MWRWCNDNTGKAILATVEHGQIRATGPDGGKMPKLPASAAEIQAGWRRGPPVERAARPNQDIVHPTADDDAGEAAGEGLFLHVRVAQFAVAEPCAIRC